MATDPSKLADQMQKTFPAAQPNGTFAPPPITQKPTPPSVPPFCGINGKPSKSAY